MFIKFCKLNFLSRQLHCIIESHRLSAHIFAFVLSDDAGRSTAKPPSQSQDGPLTQMMSSFSTNTQHGNSGSLLSQTTFLLSQTDMSQDQSGAATFLQKDGLLSQDSTFYADAFAASQSNL